MSDRIFPDKNVLVHTVYFRKILSTNCVVTDRIIRKLKNSRTVYERQKINNANLTVSNHGNLKKISEPYFHGLIIISEFKKFGVYLFGLRTRTFCRLLLFIFMSESFNVLFSPVSRFFSGSTIRPFFSKSGEVLCISSCHSPRFTCTKHIIIPNTSLVWIWLALVWILKLSLYQCLLIELILLWIFSW